MAVARTDFQAVEHGFRFPNYFEYRPRWPLGRPIRRRPLAFGLCGGMCYAALDYWYARRPVPTMESPPEQGHPLYAYLVRRQIASMARPEVLPRLVAWILRSDRAVGRLTAQAFESLRVAIDRGVPTVLLMVRSHGWQDPTLNHQVLATGYELDEFTRRGTVFVYDPVYPCEEIDLYVDLSEPDRGILIQHQRGDLTRGFFTTGFRPRTSGLPG